MGKAPKDIIRIMAAECDVPGLLATVDALQARLAAAEGAMRGVKAMALQHHGWEDRAVLLHALLVEIPTEIDAHLAPAPTKPEGGEVARG